MNQISNESNLEWIKSRMNQISNESNLEWIKSRFHNLDFDATFVECVWHLRRIPIRISTRQIQPSSTLVANYKVCKIRGDYFRDFGIIKSVVQRPSTYENDSSKQPWPLDWIFCFTMVAPIFIWLNWTVEIIKNQIGGSKTLHIWKRFIQATMAFGLNILFYHGCSISIKINGWDSRFGISHFGIRV
jgi:hypothetical protein